MQGWKSYLWVSARETLFLWHHWFTGGILCVPLPWWYVHAFSNWSCSPFAFTFNGWHKTRSFSSIYACAIFSEIAAHFAILTNFCHHLGMNAWRGDVGHPMNEEGVHWVINIKSWNYQSDCSVWTGPGHFDEERQLCSFCGRGEYINGSCQTLLNMSCSKVSDHCTSVLGYDCLYTDHCSCASGYTYDCVTKRCARRDSTEELVICPHTVGDRVIGE